MNDEEVAFRVVRLYFEEVARLGFKRQLDLDQIVNSYFYALKRLKNKDEVMKKMIEKAIAEEKAIAGGNTVAKKVESVTTTTVTAETVPIVKETTTTVTTEKK
ncbi:MAG: hypothetical protein AABW59_00980 [archaeon]